MAPKNKRAAEPKAKQETKRKRTKTAETPSEPSSGVVAIPDQSGVTRAEISSFLGALKYKAKNMKDPAREGAAAILEVGLPKP